MSKRRRKTKSLLKAILYVFFVSGFLFLGLSIIFYPSWFGEERIIVPVVGSGRTEELEIENALLDNNIEFVSLDMRLHYADIGLKNGSNVYISLSKDIAIQVSSLQLTLKQLTINGKSFDLIDFRFDKPVVRYTK